MSDSKKIAALEIGTGKMQVFIGEIVDGKMLNLVGVGQAATDGVKKADIIDVKKAAEQAQAAIVMAERSCSVPIKSVCLGISGTHIQGFRNIGSANVAGSDGIVRKGDVERAKEDAKSKALPDGRSYIHRICCGFYLDDERFCVDPVGERASRIVAEYWMIHGDSEKIRAAMHVVQSFGLEVEYLVFSGLASAMTASSPVQKENGVLVVDIGCGTSDYAFYKNGLPTQAGVIPVGGDHITNDLSFGIRLSRKNSERIKTRFGKAVITKDERDTKFWSLGDRQIGDRKIPLEAINKVIRARLEELFLLLRQDMIEHFSDGSVGEVVLTGGTSKLNGICELAEAVLERPCSLGKFPPSVAENLRHQEFSTALGLLEYARMKEMGGASKKGGSITEKIAKIFKI